ncbi:hypothetical protein VTJ83DRAFT_7159 [Remersonia thermophila]|uniref:Vacuolar membrane protein n=1 Tax=Remersonia thermophila TaxID=72144 RepID=A0ABR4D3R6_9PEZI
MGFLSHRRRDVEVNPEQKWDFISLNDFKATSVGPVFAYAFLWISLVISMAVYAVDVFTAYQLLAFNKWSSQIEPTQLIPFDISKWIFTICILLSVANLCYEYFRAIAIMRRGSVAECFLDSLAARLESIRLGSGRGWKRFLVFAELTKSKKGAEYIALFTFFSFQSWIRTLLLTGPRQVINGLTLYSVYRARLNINEANFESSLASFFDKLKALATEEPRQAVILSGMIFTFIIWFFSLLSLLLAAFLFVFFLWGYIPREDGGLTGFCERKVNKRLKQIVAEKINKAMAEEERKRKKAELKAAKKTGEDRPLTMKPSLPVLGGDDLPEMPGLNRADTFASFAEKPTRTNTTATFEMSTLGRKPTMPTRSNTKMTATSQYSSRASLLGGAADMGMSDPKSSAPTLPPVDLDGFPPTRTPTAMSNRTYGPGSQLQRMASNGSSLRGYTQSPAPYASDGMPAVPPPARAATTGPYNNYGGPGPNRANERLPPYRAEPWDDRRRGDTKSPYPGDNRLPQDRPQYPGDRWGPPNRTNTMSPYPGENRLPPPADGSQYPADQWAPNRADTQSPYANGMPRQNAADKWAPNRGDTQSPHPNGMPRQNTGDKWAPDRGDTKSPYPAGAQNPDDNNVPPYAGPGAGWSPFDDPASGRASPAPTYRTNASNVASPRPVGPPVRSATDYSMPGQRGPAQQFPPPARANTQPMHQREPSNGSITSLQSVGRTYQAWHREQSASGSSLRNMASVAEQAGEAGELQQSRVEGSRSPPPNPMTSRSNTQTPNPMNANRSNAQTPRPNPASASRSNTQRSSPGRGDDNGDNNSNGWNQDLERGGGQGY